MALSITELLGNALYLVSVVQRDQRQGLKIVVCEVGHECFCRQAGSANHFVILETFSMYLVLTLYIPPAAIVVGLGVEVILVGILYFSQFLSFWASI